MQEISFTIWAVIILLGAAQSVFLSVYLLSKSENTVANKWLAFLLIAVSLHLLEYAANISGITLHYPGLVATTYPLLFCIGPFYFLYCRHLLDKSYRFTLKTLLHFVPALLVLAVMLPFYGMPATEKVSFIKKLESGNQITIPTEQLVFMAVHVIQTVAYTFAAYRFISRKEKELKQYSSDVAVIKKLNWLNSFNFFLAIYMALYLVLVILLSVINSWQIEIDYVMLLVTSLSIYAVGYTATGNPEIFKSLPEQLQKDTEPKQTVSRTSSRHNELKEKLLLYMEANKPYLKSDLKISDLADSLSVPYYLLSQNINDEFGVNFYDFINKYRVEEAKKLLLEDSRNFKILAIAYEVGFNSKATFNRVFKKFTDLTPSEFKEKTLEIKNESVLPQS
jgi:AraC-like DNA-binding protein